MNPIQLLFIILAFPNKTYCQDTTWSNKNINEILKVDLPHGYRYEEQDIIKSYAGNIRGEYFALSYYDTAMNVNDAEKFKISLTGFAHGMSKRVPKEQYEITLTDTSIGNTKGIVIRYLASENAAYAKNLICYVTMANDHFYSFLSTIPTDIKNEKLMKHFFSRINFDTDKIKECKYLVSEILTK